MFRGELDEECTGVVAVALLKPGQQAICATCLEQLAECEIPVDAPDDYQLPVEVRSN